MKSHKIVSAFYAVVSAGEDSLNTSDIWKEF